MARLRLKRSGTRRVFRLPISNRGNINEELRRGYVRIDLRRGRSVLGRLVLVMVFFALMSIYTVNDSNTWFLLPWCFWIFLVASLAEAIEAPSAHYTFRPKMMLTTRWTSRKRRAPSLKVTSTSRSWGRSIAKARRVGVNSTSRSLRWPV